MRSYVRVSNPLLQVFLPVCWLPFDFVKVFLAMWFFSFLTTIFVSLSLLLPLDFEARKAFPCTEVKEGLAHVFF